MADARIAAVTDVAGKLTERVAAFVTKERLPGAAAGVVVDDELVWSTGYGYADVEARRAHDAQTLFRIASITKTFTATGDPAAPRRGEAPPRRPGGHVPPRAPRGIRARSGRSRP